MPRAAACALLLVGFLSGGLRAQRGGMAVHSSFPASSAHAGSTHVRGSFSPHPFSRDHFRRHHSGSRDYPYLFPYDGFFYDEPYESEQGYTEVVEPEPAPAVTQTVAPQPPPEPKVIEVPGAGNQPPAKPLPPTIFILNNGERLETRRFLLRSNDLTVTIDRRPRTIPLDQLDLAATITANRERGIHLEIPADPNEICLRF